MKALVGSVMLPFCATVLLAQGPQNFTIAVPNGTFELRSVTVERLKGGGIVSVRGELVNNTTSDWRTVSLRVALYDQQGQRLDWAYEGADTLRVFLVKKGVATKLDARLYGNRTGDIARFDMTFGSGEYPAVYILSLAKPSVSRTLEHEDGLLRVTFATPGNQHLAFSLKNKTDNPIKLDWNQVSYVDTDGKSHKIMHKGVRFIERDRAQPADTIPPGATLEDFAYPSDAVEMVSRQWTTPPLLPQAPEAANLKGKSFSLFMPLEINGATRNYNFVFTIDDLQM